MNWIQNELHNLLNSFRAISLADLEELNLLNRFDTKFLVNKDNVLEILQYFLPDFKILEINSKRFFSYHNIYFDTKDNHFFNQHHNGKLDRYKIRCRHYVDAGTTFFEIKHKTNNALTSKKRIKLDDNCNLKSNTITLLIQNETDVNPEAIFSRVFVDYERITLVNESIPEKITIDLNINFQDASISHTLSDLALIELKQKKINHNSASFQLLKSLNIQPISGFSKYCMAMIYTQNVLKYNRFKQKILMIDKFMEQSNGN